MKILARAITVSPSNGFLPTFIFFIIKKHINPKTSMMKSIMKILASGLLPLALAMVSCQKEGTETDVIIEKTQIEEGFVSKTGNNDSEIETPSEFSTPLLHKRYNASFSKEEAQAFFDVEVSEFLKERGETSRSEAFIYFQVATRTGTRNHSEADANVMVQLHFLTDNGDYWPPWFKLDNTSRDDFENGAYEFFYFRTHVPRADWIEVEEAVLALQGTDGWYVEWFDIHLLDDNRYSNVSGRSDIYSNPQTWLDNTTASGWDYFATGNIGRGRLTF